MSQLLTTRQAEELYVAIYLVCGEIYTYPRIRHKAIIAYFLSANLPNSAAALREELAGSVHLDDTTAKKYEGLLEKKWTSVVRLQKKVRPSAQHAHSQRCTLTGPG